MLRVQEPKSFLSKASLDSSRIASHVKAIDLKQLKVQKPGIVLIGAPDDRGIKNTGGIQGAKLGPDAVRRRFFKMTTPPLKTPIYDLGDIILTKTIATTHQRLQKIIEAIHASKNVPLVLGGGHDLAYPEASALLNSTKNSVSYLNIDAHLDVRDTSNGISSGSPWYLLIENTDYHQRKCSLTEFGIQAHCNSQSLQKYAQKNKIRMLWYEDLIKKKTAINELFIREFKKLRHQAIQVSFDIDSVRWSDAPGCSAAQPVGFSAAEAVSMAKFIGSQEKVKSFGVYEVSPPLEHRDQTAALAAAILYAFCQSFQKRTK